MQLKPQITIHQVAAVKGLRSFAQSGISTAREAALKAGFDLEQIYEKSNFDVFVQAKRDARHCSTFFHVIFYCGTRHEEQEE